ncbi:MAG: hypothetical protein OEV78_11180 [Spirochaetia bacterium]|nr:hypothetical protein [Spirochaetia bacterium]
MGNPLNKSSMMECPTHGLRKPSFVCSHLQCGEGLGFHQPSEPHDPELPFQHAWCDEYDSILIEEGEWNDRSEGFAKIMVICEGCLDVIRKRNIRVNEKNAT